MNIFVQFFYKIVMLLVKNITNFLGIIYTRRRETEVFLTNKNSISVDDKVI